MWIRRFEPPQGRCRNDVNAGIVEQGSGRCSTGNRNFRGFGVLAAEGACRELQHQAAGSDRDEGNVGSERGDKRRRCVCVVALKMLGFKRFETAAVTIRGIELAEKIKKQQFNLKPLTGKATTAPEMWAVVLAA